MPWKKHMLTAGVQWDSVIAAGEAVMGELHEYNPRLYPEWVALTGQEGAGVLAYTFADGDAVKGYALIERHKRPLNYYVGQLTFYRKQLTRYELLSQPLISGCGDERRRTTIQLSALRSIGGELSDSDAISIEGVPMDQPFYSALFNDTYIKSKFLVMQLGKPFGRHYIDFPASLDDYWSGISSRSRSTNKRKIKKLERACNADVELRCFEKADEVDAWLDDAIAVSKKTYQWNLLGIGLRDRQALRRGLIYAAEKGWFRCYILYCKGKPTCFMEGLQINGHYFYEDVGYDPEWGDLSVGTVLQLMVIDDLYTRNAQPVSFDFSTGDGEHKERFGNRTIRQVNLLLLPRCFKNLVVVGCYRASVAISDGLRWFAEALGIKPLLKRLLRRAFS